MRIISWNVNGIRATHNKGELENLLRTYAPDVLFLQEIKGTPDKFPEALNTPEGYEAFYNPAEKAGYAGTGLWIHEDTRKYVHSIQTGFIGDPTANEGRVIHLILEKEGLTMDVFGIYFPNGGKSEEAWQGKLVFYREFSKRMDELRALGHLVLW
jgi:exodeoxyribonuclease-3